MIALHVLHRVDDARLTPWLLVRGDRKIVWPVLLFADDAADHLRVAPVAAWVSEERTMAIGVREMHLDLVRLPIALLRSRSG